MGIICFITQPDVYIPYLIFLAVEDPLYVSLPDLHKAPTNCKEGESMRCSRAAVRIHNLKTKHSNYWNNLLEQKKSEMVPETVTTIHTIVPNGSDTTVITTVKFVEGQENESTETIKPTPKTCKKNVTIKTVNRSVGGQCRREGCEFIGSGQEVLCTFHSNPKQKQKATGTPEALEELLGLAATYREPKRGRTDWNTLWPNATVLQEAEYTLGQCKEEILTYNNQKKKKKLSSQRILSTKLGPPKGEKFR